MRLRDSRATARARTKRPGSDSPHFDTAVRLVGTTPVHG